MSNQAARVCSSHNNALSNALFVLAGILLTLILTGMAFILSLPAYAARMAYGALRLFYAMASVKKNAQKGCAVFVRKIAGGIAGPLSRAFQDAKNFNTRRVHNLSTSGPIFHDDGKWQKSGLIYLGGSACLFSAALFLQSFSALLPPDYYVSGPFARKPVIRKYLDFRNTPTRLDGMLPLSDMTISASASSTGITKNTETALIFRAPALQTEAELSSDNHYARHLSTRQPRRHGPVIFSQGRVSIQTVAGEIILSTEKKKDQAQHKIMAGRSRLPGNAEFLALHPMPFGPDTDAWLEEVAEGNANYPPNTASWKELMEKKPEIRVAQCVRKDGAQRAALYSLLRSLEGVRDKFSTRREQYLSVATVYAEKYQLATSLLLAIMHTESGFNPNAVSPKKAIGLMQVVPHSAGNEVYRFLKGEQGTPSMDALFNPENNIRYGATYLHLLDRYHFAGVTNSASRQLCVIAGYNGGPNAVLRHFHPNRQKALEKINGMTTEQLYKALTKRFPYAETRRYVESVKARMVNYATF